jgi:dihydroneopterin aldolase
MAEKLISHHEWQTKLPYPTDKVLVRNLSLNANAGLNVWGHKKTQPIHISVTLYLNHPFTSAAQDDKVDQTTVHYGTLSKSILSLVGSRSSEWRNTARLAAVVEEAIQASVASPKLLAAYEITVSFPKGCMLGDAAAHTLSKALSSGLTSRSLHLKNVRVPCIIGVNSHERLLKQAVVSNVSVDCINDGDASDSYTQLEQIITKVLFMIMHRH